MDSFFYKVQLCCRSEEGASLPYLLSGFPVASNEKVWQMVGDWAAFVIK